jgi:hypothetical protein
VLGIFFLRASTPLSLAFYFSIASIKEAIVSLSPMRQIKYIVIILLSGLGFTGFSQPKDSVNTHHTPKYKLSVLIYTRNISDAKGNTRMDENIVPNYWITNYLRCEVGFRQGERPAHFDSYYHYKAELQTKSFWKTVRVIARISDNVINYPSPSYRRTNELFAVETRFHLTRSLQLLASGGYVFSAQQNRALDALPTSQGMLTNSPLFRSSLRYLLKDKGFLEVVYGSYDTFNPYSLNQPFMQFAGDHEFGEHCTFTWYLRYQYDYNVLTPFNYFLGLGLRFHLIKS